MGGRYVSSTWAHDPSLYAPAKYRRACTYDAFLPDGVTGFNPTIPAELAGVVSDAEAAIRSLNDHAHPALRPMARLLLRTESIASSKVEGLQADARSLARAEAKADVGTNVGSDVAEVLANIDAMELAVEETAARAAITLNGLVGIHEALMRRAPNAAVAGRVRNVQNWIGGNDYNPCGADFVPPPPEHVASLLADLCEFCNSDHLPPLIHAAVAHAQFETIHPFEDGNGRTGRALIHVLLRRRGLAPSYVPPISVVLAANKNRYIDGLAQYRNGDLDGWIEHFAVAAAQAASLADRYLRRVRDLQETWRLQLRAHTDLRSDAAAWAVIDELPGHPVVTVPVATAVTGRSKSSTALAVDQLVEAGILLPLSGSKRNRAWEAVGLLDLLAGLEAGR
ncbi:MAG TPA: Fic family protein [Acidimicrobiales bacterium]|nr:Fic family protein [Acidimicrobiales bacterium]